MISQCKINKRIYILRISTAHCSALLSTKIKSEKLILQNVIYKLLATKYFSWWLSIVSALLSTKIESEKLLLQCLLYKMPLMKHFSADSTVTQQCWALKIYINTLWYELYKILQKNKESHKRSRRSSVSRFFL